MIDIAIESGSDEMKDDKKSAVKTNSAIVIPVMEEQATVAKQVVESGRLRIHKTVQEHDEVLNLALTHEEHVVERVPVNQYVDTTPPAIRYEGQTMIIPVLKEVVEVRLLIVEELHITKKQVQTQVNQPVTLRKEEVKVEHQDVGPSNKQPL